jgi:thiol-disulfide isomerase/thioredoxin
MAHAGQAKTATATTRKIAFLMKTKTTFAALVATIAIGCGQQTVDAPDVRSVTLDLQGKVVLVNFWGTYCGPCLREMPKVIETHRQFAPRGLETIAVAVRQDSREKVVAFARERALPFDVVYDASGDIAREFGKVRITPTIFILDREGRVLAKAVGNPDWKVLQSAVEKALRP